MRRILALAVLAGLSGCAGEYSKVPEPTGEWVPANPVSLMTMAAPPRPVVRRAVWRRRARVVPAVVRPAAPAPVPALPPPSDKVAAQ